VALKKKGGWQRRRLGTGGRHTLREIKKTRAETTSHKGLRTPKKGEAGEARAFSPPRNKGPLSREKTKLKMDKKL